MAGMDEAYRDLSFWHDTVPGSMEPRRPVDGDIEADVAIVGAGYTGLWTAYYLNRIDPSQKITILESEIAGFGASGRNGGWCSAYLSGIDGWMEDPVHREGAIRLQRQMFDAVNEVGRVAVDESIDCHYDRSGALEIAVIPQQAKRLQDELRHRRELGFGEEDYRWLEHDELAQTLVVDQALCAVHMRHCAAVHPSRLTRGLAETVEAAGVTIHENSPVRKIQRNELTTPHGKVKAGTVLLATEGYSSALPGFRGTLIPVHSMMVVTEPLSGELLEGIRFSKRFCFGNLDRMVTYGHLTADGRIAFGCRGSYHFNSGIRRFHPADPKFDLVRQNLLRFFPSLSGVGFTHAWGGCMGVSRTLRPFVNYDPGRRFGWAGGYFGNGVGAANLAGRTMADLVTGRDTDRVHTPWANPAGKDRKWEPEPLRWLGIKARAGLMQAADRAEYRNSPFAPAISKALETLFP